MNKVFLSEYVLLIDFQNKVEQVLKVKMMYLIHAQLQENEGLFKLGVEF
jgi:hypothetical protein